MAKESSSNDFLKHITDHVDAIVETHPTVRELRKQLAIQKGQTSSIKNIETYLSKKYEFRYNTIVDRTEIKAIKTDQYFRLLTERDLNSLFRELNRENHKCSLNVLKSVLNSDFVPVLDPFTEYFTSLPKWDNKTDYIAQLAGAVKTNDDIFWLECFRKWIVAVVACAINEYDINHQVLVLSGKQGLGKSRFLNGLLPAGLKGYLYSGIVNPNNKDTLVNLSENLLINLDELENLNKTELGSLKSLITQSAIRLRKAYGHFNENVTRRASFMGSVNDTEFLTDNTGNRRYLCFTATDINLDHGVDMDLVYSQAYSLLTKKIKGKAFKWWFDQEDIERINTNNESYLRISNEEQMLLKYFKLPVDDNYDLLTPVDILGYIEQREKIRLMDHSSVRRLGQALQKHGFTKKSTPEGKPYKVVLIRGAKSFFNEVEKENGIPKKTYKAEYN